MPRRRRFCRAGFPIHVIQRGINRQLCFTSDADMAAYAHWLAEGAQKFEVHLHGWVFMVSGNSIPISHSLDQFLPTSKAVIATAMFLSRY
jgi:hypothetical protein